MGKITRQDMGVSFYNMLDQDALLKICGKSVTYMIHIDGTKYKSVESKYKIAIDFILQFIEEYNLAHQIFTLTKESRNEYCRLLLYIFLNGYHITMRRTPITQQILEYLKSEYPNCNRLLVPSLYGPRQKTEIEVFCEGIEIKLSIEPDFSTSFRAPQNSSSDEGFETKHLQNHPKNLDKSAIIMKIYNTFSVSELNEAYKLWKVLAMASILNFQKKGDISIKDYYTDQLMQFHLSIMFCNGAKYAKQMGFCYSIRKDELFLGRYLHSIYWVFMTAFQVELNLPKDNKSSILLDELLLQHLDKFPNCTELHNIPGINEGQMNLTQIAIFKEQKVCTKVTDDAERVVGKEVANQSKSVASHSII